MRTRFLNTPFVSLIRYEISYKKSMLTSLMEYQATCLGLLVDQNEGFDFNKIAKEMIEPAEGRQDVDFCDVSVILVTVS